MLTRTLGRSELELPVICFGAWAIGGWAWGGSDDPAAREALDVALEVGMNAIDTAPVYGFGHSERLVGEVLRGRRGDAKVLTKAGLRWDDPRGELFFHTEGPGGDRLAVRRNSRPDSLRFEVEASLGRLGIERIDLLQIHWPDPTTPIPETMGALLELRGEGKIAEIGVSNYDDAQMAEAQAALGDVPLASNQVPYSLVVRGIEDGVLPAAQRQGVGVIAYSPLEMGLLTGKVGADRRFPDGDTRQKRPSFQASNRARVNGALDEAVRPIAEGHGCSLAQVVLAWTLAQGGVSSLLGGARSAEQVRENHAAADLVLGESERERIDRAFTGLGLGSTSPRRPLWKRLLGR